MRLPFVVLFLVWTSLTIACEVGSESRDDAKGCQYYGVQVARGVEMRCGCNWCRCEGDDNWYATFMGCGCEPEDAQSPASSTFPEVAEGCAAETFAAYDGDACSWGCLHPDDVCVGVYCDPNEPACLSYLNRCWPVPDYF